MERGVRAFEQCSGCFFYKNLIEIIAAKVGIAVAGKHFDHTAFHRHNRHVKCTSAQVIDHDFLIGCMLAKPRTVSQCGSGGFIDDPQHFQSGNAPGILRGMTLAFIKKSRNGNHRLSDRLFKMKFGLFF